MLQRLIIIFLLTFAQEAVSAPSDFLPDSPLPALGKQTLTFENGADLAILIDDMGHSIFSNTQAVALPGPVSFAFLPFARHSKEMALNAKALKKDVLMHAPMESIHKLSLGPGGMTSDMSEVDFKAMLLRDIDAIPHLVGVNNHMGSQLTTLNDPMRWTMDVLKERGLFFIDSRTTAKSVAWQQAVKAGMVGVQRDVFLDHELNRRAIQRQFLKAIARAKYSGHALLIAHPHQISINFLKNNLARLKDRGVQLISVSQLVEKLKLKRLAQASEQGYKKAS